MSMGIIVDVSCVIIGGILGSILGKYIPDRIKDVLPKAFALGTISMSLSSVIAMHSMPAVILALLLGTIAGTFLKIESSLRRAGEWLASRLGGGGHVGDRERALDLFAIAVILFCTGATGIYGSIRSAMAGDDSLLYAKAVLDAFTAPIFASTIGISVAVLGIPMFIILSSIYLTASVIAPLVTPAMLADFTGCGGMLLLATGIRMAEIKHFPVADMLPALLLIMPVSYLFSMGI